MHENKIMFSFLSTNTSRYFQLSFASVAFYNKIKKKKSFHIRKICNILL